MPENKRIGIHIATLIDALIDEISYLKPNELDSFDLSDLYNDVYDLHLMSNKYCKAE